MTPRETDQWVESLLAETGLSGRTGPYEGLPVLPFSVDNAFPILLDAFTDKYSKEEAFQLATAGSAALREAMENGSKILDVPPHKSSLTDRDERAIKESKSRGIQFDEETGYLVEKEDQEGVKNQFGRVVYSKRIRLARLGTHLPPKDADFDRRLKMALDKFIKRNFKNENLDEILERKEANEDK